MFVAKQNLESQLSFACQKDPRINLCENVTNKDCNDVLIVGEGGSQCADETPICVYVLQMVVHVLW